MVSGKKTVFADCSNMKKKFVLSVEFQFIPSQPQGASCNLLQFSFKGPFPVFLKSTSRGLFQFIPSQLQLANSN